MNGEGQDPQNRKEHMHTLNEWLGQEHATGYETGYKQGVEDSYEAARKAWNVASKECQLDELLDAIYNLLDEKE